MRRVVTAVAVLGCVAGLAFAFAHDALYLRLIARAAHSMVGTELEVRGSLDFTGFVPLQFEARDVALSVGASESRIARVSGAVALRELLGGVVHFHRLAVEGARITRSPAAGAKERVRPGVRRLPLIDELTLDDVHVELPGAPGAGPIEIVSVRAGAGGDGRIRAGGRGTLDGKHWRVDATLGTRAELLDPATRFPVSVDLTLPDWDLTAVVSGSWQDLLAGRGAMLDVRVTVRDVAPLVVLAGIDAPLAGSLEASGSLRGDRGALGLSGLALQLTDGVRLRASMTGSVAHLRALDGLALDLSLSMPLADLRSWLPPHVGEAGRLELRTALAGDRGQLSFDGLSLELVGTHPIAGKASGSGLLALDWSDAPDEGGPAAVAVDLADEASVDLRVDLTGDTRAAGALAGSKTPDLGPFSLGARVAGSARRWKFDDLDARLGSGKPLVASVTGALEVAGGRDAGWTIDAAALDVAAHGADASLLPALPLLGGVGAGPWRVAGKLGAKNGKLSIAGLDLDAGVDAGLRLALGGRVAVLGPLGPAVIEQAQGVELSGRLGAASTRQLGAAIGLALPDLGRVEASFDVKRASAGWSLGIASARISGTDGFELNASGTGTGLPHDPVFALDVQARASDPRVLARAFGASVPITAQVTADGKLGREGKRTTFEGDVGIGATRLAARAAIEAGGARPRVVVSLDTPTLDVAELGWFAEPGPVGKSNAAGSTEPAVRVMFDTAPWDVAWLDAVDLDLSLAAKVLTSGEFEAGPLEVRAHGEGGKLAVDLDELSFESGEITAEIRFDASSSPPELSVRGQGKNLSVGALNLQVVSGQAPVQGRYAFDVDLRSRGNTSHEFASTASGHYGHVVVDGRLPGGDLDVLALRPLRMMLTHAASKDHTAVQCTVVELRVVDGVASAESLFLRTEKMLVVGTGRLDLGAETVDVVVHTKPVHEGLLDLFKGKHAARVHGPISDPKIDADLSGAVVGAAADGALAAAAVMAPPVFAAVIGLEYLDEFLKNDDAEPCKP